MIGDRWGVTEDEVAYRYPCDAIVTRPTLKAWRAVTVAVPPDRLWPWVTQIRIAPYSYDWVDNLGRRSPQQLRHLPEPVVGEAFTVSVTGPVGRVLAVEPGVQFTGQILGAVMSYVLVPNAGSTRLLLKIVMARGRLLAPLVSAGDLVMARRQLLNLKHLAERERPACGP